MSSSGNGSNEGFGCSRSIEDINLHASASKKAAIGTFSLRVNEVDALLLSHNR